MRTNATATTIEMIPRVGFATARGGRCRIGTSPAVAVSSTSACPTPAARSAPFDGVFRHRCTQIDSDGGKPGPRSRTRPRPVPKAIVNRRSDGAAMPWRAAAGRLQRFAAPAREPPVASRLAQFCRESVFICGRLSAPHGVVALLGPFAVVRISASNSDEPILWRVRTV